MTENNWYRAGYKGGSEAGVLQYTHVLQKEKGADIYTLSVTVNNSKQKLNTDEITNLTSRLISLIKKWIPNNVRIPSFILIIASFVTFTDYFLKAFFPGIAESLSLFIPLIVVNCLILGRQEAFASKNPTHRAIFDAIGMGLGFTWVLVLLSTVRELLGMGTFFGLEILGAAYQPMIIMILPGGAFITLGVIVGIMNVINRKVESQNG